MNIDLREMRSVVTLADHRHFGRAAAALHLSQPALTKQIHKVEDLLGGLVFVREARQVRPTRAGELLIARIRPLLDEAQFAEELFKRALRGEAGRLRIGFGIAALVSGLPDVVHRFRRQFPEVQIVMREMSTAAQIEALENGSLDLGVLRVPVLSQELCSWPLFKDRLVVAVGPGIPVRFKGLKDLARIPFIAISRSASQTLHDHMLRVCRDAGFTPRITQEVSEIHTALNIVRSGACVAVIPNSARALRVPRVRFVETGVASAAIKMGIAIRKSLTQDPMVRRFLSEVRKSYASADAV
ncbi:MAG TPA: LysR substrate-binding domain-containing protein [Terriglobales bacterium]|nr:LysR substrate-binding domain-containing protein [Terriglobales bacterium]